MCQHNLPCSIVLPTACFPEGPSPHFTLCSFWRRRPRLEAVLKLRIYAKTALCYRNSVTFKNVTVFTLSSSKGRLKLVNLRGRLHDKILNITLSLNCRLTAADCIKSGLTSLRLTLSLNSRLLAVDCMKQV